MRKIPGKCSYLKRNISLQLSMESMADSFNFGVEYNKSIKMIKILHTADWHIGKRLYKKSLDEDIVLFFEWMVSVIKEEGIDVLVVAGDIFDSANPSHASRKVYYDVLHKLIETKVRVIITSGNHDSPTNLSASSDILKMLDIHVVGGVGESPEDEIIFYKKENERVVFAAVPFLRDKDLRREDQLDDPNSRIEQIRQGIVDHYTSLRDYISSKYHGNFTTVGIGHLYLQSASTSDSERDIQLGNQAGIKSTQLSDLFDYAALGHIHRPQSFDEGKIRYSGSPVVLSFSEREDQKQVVLVEVEKGKLKTTVIPIPSFRKMKKISGDFDTVRTKLQQGFSLSTPLQSYVEVEVVEKEHSIALIQEINDFLDQQDNSNFTILKERISFENSPRSLSQQIGATQINDLKPIEVLNKKLEYETYPDKVKEEIKDAFNQILEEAYLHLED